MKTVFCSITGVLLLTVLQAGARADSVTWSRCKEQWDCRGRVLGSGPDNNATWLNLFYCQIKNLDLDAFNGLPNLDSIYINGNSIKYINPAVFSSVNNIIWLDISRNKLREVPNFGEHSLLPRLTTLDLCRNIIGSLSNPNTFSACGQLQVIYFSHNYVQYIHPNIFKPLKSLKTLWLFDNKIKMITDSMFAVKSLEVLNLSYNLIEHVSSRAFHGCELKELYLEFNRITQLPVKFVSELNSAGASIIYFHFHDNPWHCASLLELMADVKRAGVPWRVYSDSYEYAHYIGKQSVCVFTDRYPPVRASSPRPNRAAASRILQSHGGDR